MKIRLVCIALLTSACLLARATWGQALEEQTTESPEGAENSDVLIIGAGLAGLSAAIDSASGGARVLVIDMNSVFGGHGIQSGGVAVVGSPMQEAAGFHDTPEQAYQDWMEWTVDGHPEWTRYYVENSSEMIYDWVTGFGVRFDRLRPSHGNTVPRFHMTHRRGLNLVRPLFLEALRYSNITFRWNANAEHLIKENGEIVGAVGTDWRMNQRFEVRARAVILATGGFQSNIAMVKANWREDLPAPADVYSMSGQNSRGSGHRMAEEVGAALVNLDRQYNGYTVIPNALGFDDDRGFTANNARSIWINSVGQRFVTERGVDRYVFDAVMRQQPDGHWAIYDEDDKEGFTVSGPHFVSADTIDVDKIQRMVVENGQITNKAQTLGELAELIGVPQITLNETVARFNDQIRSGETTDIDGLPPEGEPPSFTIDVPPYYATKLYPMANKSAGGIAIDMDTRVLDSTGEPIPGLYAAGEVTGSAGINGLNGLDGMFTGPAILTGRVAGRAVARELAASSGWSPVEVSRQEGFLLDDADLNQDWAPSIGTEQLDALLAITRDGYWHFTMAHQLVRERGYQCVACHSARVPFVEVNSRAGKAAQALVCDACHLAPEGTLSAEAGRQLESFGAETVQE